MTSTEARNDIFALLKASWDLLAAGIFLPKPEILWQGQENGPPGVDNAYARATVLHMSGKQASLASNGGALKWERRGACIVQCFGPLGSGKSLTIAEGLATIAKNAFEGKASPGGIWFRNCRLNEVGPTDSWFQVNAIAEFYYDEVK